MKEAEAVYLNLTVWAEKEGVRFESGFREFEGMCSFNGEMGAYVQYGVGK